MTYQPNISYAITTHNEGENVKKLLDDINKYKSHLDEIVILDDFSTETHTCNALKTEKNVFKKKFNDDFAKHKNYLNSLCKKEYILQIDGDETLSVSLHKNIQEIIRLWNDIDLFWIPRENKLHNLDMSYIKKWKWNVDKKNRINYPDYQGRLYKNSNHIRWTRKVHEIIEGHKTQKVLPHNSNIDIIHHRDMSKQIKNNEYYDRTFGHF